ncbi:Uncharacterised protein g2075 [Pycnogonum litorale]
MEGFLKEFVKMKILFYFVVIVITERKAVPCVESEMTSVCTPTFYSLHVVIKCCHENATEIYKYFDDLQNNKSLERCKVVIRSNTIATLRPALFGQLKIRDVNIQIKNLSKLDPQTFGGHNNDIEYLTIKYAKLSLIPITIISQLTNLRTLAIQSSKNLKFIKEYAFLGVQSSKLYSVSFYRNNIRYIGEGAFSNLFRLRYIDLNFNKITEINANIFPVKWMILTVFANRNLLTEIPSQLISKMKAPSTLELQNNLITDVNEETIVKILSEKLHVDLSLNPINCGCNFARLATYNSKMNTQKYVTATCKLPAHLSKMPLHLLNVSDFLNCVTTMTSPSSVSLRDTVEAVIFDVRLLSSTLLIILIEFL